MLDKYEVAKTIGEEFNYPWIEEMNCFDGFPEVLKNEDGTDIEGCDWYMGEGENDFGTFIDIEVDMTPELREAAQHWCGEMRFDEDEFGNYLQVDYDTAEEMAVMRNDDTEEEDYDPGNDHIQILLKSQTHLRQLAEGIKAYNKEFPAKPKSKEETLETIRNDGNALANVDDSLKADREFMLEAVKSNGRALKYASDSLKADREVVLEAVKNDAYALQYASDTLKADREVVLEAVETSVAGLEYADDSLKADREIVLEAVKSNGRALKYASEELQNDPELKKLAKD
jgi:hypothetical protein